MEELVWESAPLPCLPSFLGFPAPPWVWLHLQPSCKVGPACTDWQGELVWAFSSLCSRVAIKNFFYGPHFLFIYISTLNVSTVMPRHSLSTFFLPLRTFPLKHDGGSHEVLALIPFKRESAWAVWFADSPWGWTSGSASALMPRLLPAVAD